jgi:hypothetical protein
MQDTAGSGFNFTASAGGTDATITGIGTHTNGGVLVIPPTVMYGGTTYNVTTIGDLSRTAFSGELTFPSSVTTISYYAFYGCGNLQTVIIPATVRTILDAAFAYCYVANAYLMGNATWPKYLYQGFTPGYTKVYVKAGAGTETGWWGGVGHGVYNGMFGENYLINSIAITYPTSTYISKGSALSYSTFIDGSAAVPGTFTWESPTTICNVAANHNVKFTPNNPQLQALGYTKVVPVAVSVYNTISGVKYLYSGSTATVIGYDSALSATLIIPSTFTDGIEYMVTSIGASAFAGSGLTSVTIPASVTAIGASAFAGCTVLANAYFLGNAIPDNIPFTSQLPQIYVKSVATEWGTTFSGCNVTQVKISTVPKSTAYTAGIQLADTSLSGGRATVDGTFSWESGTFTVADLYRVNFTPLYQSSEYSFDVYIEVDIILPTTTDGVTASISRIGNATVISIPVINGVLNIPAKVYDAPVTVVAQGAISDEAKDALTDLNVPEGIETLGSKLCQGCPNLASANLPSTLKFIGDYVFAGCPTLRNGAVPDGASVGNYTYSGCIGMV